MAEKKAGKTASETGLVTVGKLYTIVSKQSAKVIEAGEGDNVSMRKPTRRKTQQWKVETAEEGFVKFTNAATGKVLDIVWEGTVDGAQIHQWDYLGGDNQKWSLEPTGEDTYKVKAKASGKCIDIVDMSLEEGALLQIWQDCDGLNQRWIFKEVKTAAKAVATKTPAAKETQTAPKAKKASPKAKAEKKEPASKKK